MLQWYRFVWISKRHTCDCQNPLTMMKELHISLALNCGYQLMLTVIHISGHAVRVWNQHLMFKSYHTEVYSTVYRDRGG